MDVSQLLTGRNAAAPLIILFLIATLKAVWPELARTKVGVRLLPALPLLFGLAFGCCGLFEGAHTWEGKLVMGFVAGAVAGHLFKFGKTSLVEWGKDVAAQRRASMMPPPPGEATSEEAAIPEAPVPDAPAPKA